jgi:phenylacetate-CoA ligase
MSERKYWEPVETLPRADLQALQLQRLREHLTWARERSPYYARSFAESKAPSDLKSLDDLRHFPFINKSIERDRQLAAPLLGDLAAVPERDVVFVAASSGSTGVATLSPFTAQDFEDFQNAQARLFWGTGMRPTDRYVHALNFTLFVGGPDVIGAQKLGALCIWAGTVSSDRLLFIMKNLAPTSTWTTPSYAWHLGETARSQGIDPAKDLAIRRIIVAGEPGGSIPATRQAIEAMWKADLYDFYGISDIFGACAGMCQEKHGLHLVEDQILLEVIDPKTGEPVKGEEPGELVMTTLQKKARPMIRFRTGDIGRRLVEPCPCGRTHVRFVVQGRLDDMFIVSGVNVFPSDVEFVVRDFPGLTGEYRVVVYTEERLTRFDIEVEKQKNSQEQDETLAEELRRRIALRVGVKPRQVRVLAEGELPRSTHKAKRLIDRRGDEQKPAG